MTTTFDREREKIGRQLEEGFLTPTEHRRISRAIDRAEAKQERHNSRLVLRRSLLRSLGRQSA